jgi:hypothetical protein
MFISSAPISRNGTLAQISRAVNADLTVSAGLHCAFFFLCAQPPLRQPYLISR